MIIGANNDNKNEMNRIVVPSGGLEIKRLYKHVRVHYYIIFLSIMMVNLPATRRRFYAIIDRPGRTSTVRYGEAPLGFRTERRLKMINDY